MDVQRRQKIVIVGAGPVGALAGLYAARRGHDVEVYELRSGKHAETLRWRRRLPYHTPQTLYKPLLVRAALFVYRQPEEEQIK